MLSIHRTDNCVFVHRLEPRTDQALRVKWHKIYIDGEGKETSEPTDNSSKERIEAEAVLDTVTISRDGVLNARAARRLDNWRWDKSRVEGMDTDKNTVGISISPQVSLYNQYVLR